VVHQPCINVTANSHGIFVIHTSVTTMVSGGTLAMHQSNYQSIWYFCNLPATVTAMASGGTLAIHQCNCQPAWYFCNPCPSVPAMGIGGMLTIRQHNSQPIWCFCNLPFNVTAMGIGGTSPIHQCNYQPLWCFCNPYASINTMGIGHALVICQRNCQLSCRGVYVGVPPNHYGVCPCTLALRQRNTQLTWNLVWPYIDVLALRYGNIVPNTLGMFGQCMET
jgi:hypothetical protein